MALTICPHCQMRILPRLDGTCPSCNNLITQTETPPPSKPSGAVIKRAAKSADRRKAASAAGRSRPQASPNAQAVEAAFSKHLETAQIVWKGSLRVALSYIVAGLILGVICVIFSFFTWEQEWGINSFVNKPSSATWVFIWIGVAVFLGFALFGAVKGNQWGKAQVRDIIHENPGFADFYKAYLRRYWPKSGMPVGPALDKFVEMIGKK
jgi:hypothetical protein